MIVRAFDLGLIDKDEKSHLFRSLTRRRWRGPLKEPYDADMKVEQPRMLRRGFETLLQSGYFSKSAILASLPQPPREIEEIAALQPGTLSNELEGPQVRLRDRERKLLDIESGKVIEFPPR